MNHLTERIVINPAICHGKPVIRGTRVPVAIVLGSLAGGMSIDDIRREYELAHEDILAAFAYAAELVEEEQHHPLASGR